MIGLLRSLQRTVGPRPLEPSRLLVGDEVLEVVFRRHAQARRLVLRLNATGTGVLVSIVLHPPPDRHLPELSLVAALATAEAVEIATGLTAQVKWPNDVMLSRSKVAGIISELADGVVVAGIGVNVNQTREQLPLDATTPPASLRTVTGHEHDRAALLGSLLFRLERAYDGWREGGLTALYEELAPRDFLRGRRVTVDGEEATAHMILRDGRLEVETDGELRALESGEVRYRA
jgi:biotin-[acetyl-CoA-carboxylase] ligase BirA-like protein